jgi:hypothetical protein
MNKINSNNKTKILKAMKILQAKSLPPLIMQIWAITSSPTMKKTFLHSLGVQALTLNLPLQKYQLQQEFQSLSSKGFYPRRDTRKIVIWR